MSTEFEPKRDPEPVSGLAVGGMAFGGSVMLIIGIFHLIAGLVAIVSEEFFAVIPNYIFAFDVTVWGWIQLILGVVIVGTGVSLIGRLPWAGVAAILVAGLSAIANFVFIPYYPFWSLLVIGLDVWVIWSVTRPGALRT